jgi:hypothetical protein
MPKARLRLACHIKSRKPGNDEKNLENRTSNIRRYLNAPGGILSLEWPDASWQWPLALLRRQEGRLWPEARVYLELQHVPDVPMAMKLSLGVFTDDLTKLQFEMRDGHDKLIKPEYISIDGVLADPFSG